MTFTIRVKLIVLAVLGASLGLGTLVVYSKKKFEEDKEKFIQEAGAMRSKGLALQIKNLIEATAKINKTFTVLHKKDPKFITELLNRDNNQLAFAIIKKQTVKRESEEYIDEYEMVEELTYLFKAFHRRMENDSSFDLDKLKNIPARLVLNTNAMQHKREYVFSTTHLTGAPSMAYARQNRQKGIYYISIIDLNALNVELAEDAIFTNSMWDEGGKHYIKNMKYDDREYIDKILESSSSFGERTITYDGRNKPSILVSFYKLKKYKIALIAEITRDKAHKFGKVLVKRSVLFGIMFVSLCMFLTVIAVHSATANLSKIKTTLEKFLEGDFSFKISEFGGRDETREIGELFNQFSDSIFKIVDQRTKEIVNKTQHQNDKGLSQFVLESAFPVESADFEKLEISGMSNLSAPYRGQWWHYSTPAGENGRVVFCMGSMSTQNVQAALAVSSVKAALTVAEKIPNIPPSQLLVFLNKTMYGIYKGTNVARLFLGIFDPEKGKVFFANAGQNAPLIFQYDKPNELAALAENTGLPLGRDPASEYKDRTITVKPNQTLLFYGDGILKMENIQGKQLGQKNMLGLIVGSIKKNPGLTEAIGMFDKALAQFSADKDQENDATLFAVRFK